MPRDKAGKNERHNEGLYQCYVGTLWKDGLPIHHRDSQEDHDCGPRWSTTTPTFTSSWTPSLEQCRVTFEADVNLLLKDQSFDSLRKCMSDRESNWFILVENT